MENYVILKAKMAKESSSEIAKMDTNSKNLMLLKMSEGLENSLDIIIEENKKDVFKAKEKGFSSALIDRLTLNEKRIKEMANGLRKIAQLDDPIGKTVSAWTRPNGLQIQQVRVPLGVIGIIYEARPNVTSDAAGLCIKSGNAVILKGGSEAINSNKIIVDVLRQSLEKNGFNKEFIQFIDVTDREAVKMLMKLNEYIDVLIPRGGEGLIKFVVENSTVPVIETGVGNCHIYVDSSADFEMAENIIINAKVQRPGVCNAAESLLVNEDIASEFLPVICKKLIDMGVEVRGCEKTRQIINDVIQATEEDFKTEFLDLIISVKVVEGIDEAIKHINRYGTKHSESIITKDYFNANKFLREVDAAAVYANASTRFTDGFEFGFGAEIGISTQKMHARGPMGLEALTSVKYVVYGEGQIRE
ncbi:Gamma-glutamyl phosphate reductase [Caloramator mitchellensis]|uniref:Gamma-glutamyl phosphate reductase n=1 Tax=Caloramator mitchellensis TaxID=908809 RepID=A0A0R3K446_CALMK|nr:glutamate-5-semialdehyde dehydrogenase [Caloramator mitchellensis]KRQ87861.1 Gamma-glutamyl phosphate reductase [Caloramator mitchellensis]